MTKLTFVATATSLVFLAGCAHSHKRAENNPPPTPKQIAVMQLDTDRNAYVTQTQSRVDEMTKFSEQLRAKAAAAQKPQAKKLENAADDMDASLKDVEKELTDVRQAAPENWLDEKRDVTKTMQRAETQYNDSVRLIQ
jgi:glutamine amidotransferase PdxT